MELIDPDTKQGFDKLVEETRDEAIRIMKIEFPKRLIALNGMSQDILKHMEPFDKPIDPMKTVVEPNDYICRMLEKIKTELWDMMNYIITIKFYIMLNQPKKEDGNTFGVEVQNEIVNSLSEAVDTSKQVISEMITYFSKRGSIIANSRKNPYIADYASGALSFDNREILFVSQTVVEIRNNYAALYDKIMKNYDKIVKPRGTQTGLKWDSMY